MNIKKFRAFLEDNIKLLPDEKTTYYIYLIQPGEKYFKAQYYYGRVESPKDPHPSALYDYREQTKKKLINFIIKDWGTKPYDIL